MTSFNSWHFRVISRNPNGLLQFFSSLIISMHTQHFLQSQIAHVRKREWEFYWSEKPQKNSHSLWIHIQKWFYATEAIKRKEKQKKCEIYMFSIFTARLHRWPRNCEWMNSLREEEYLNTQVEELWRAGMAIYHWKIVIISPRCMSVLTI